MIITKDIVFLNFPKTGSSFLRAVIKRIYEDRIRNNIILKLGIKLKLIPYPYGEFLTPNNIFKGRESNPKDQHGLFSQIPENDQHKKIVAIVRNPYDRFLSSYEYRFWEKYPGMPNELLKKHLPHFPNLSIDDYIDYQKLLVKYSFDNLPTNLKLGTTSLQFIYFFSKNPSNVINNLTEDYLKSDTLYKTDFASITFLRQESLNEELSNFLLVNNFSHKETNLALNYPIVNKTKELYTNREELLTKKVIDYIDEYEYLYLNILRLNSINYFRK